MVAFRPYDFDPPGVQWTKTFAGVGNAMGHYVEQTTDGGYILTGITFVGPDIKLLLVKTNMHGDTVWTRTMGMGGLQPTRAFMAQQTADGGYIVGVNGVLTVGRRQDLWLVKLDGRGNVVWQNEVTSDIFPYLSANGHSIAQTNDGGYAVAAIKTRSDSSLMLFKTDSLGNRQWSRRYPIAVRTLGTYDRVSLRRTSDGGFIVGTRTLLKLDSMGNLQWLRTFSDVACANSVLQTPDGGYVATGQAQHYSSSSIYLFKTNADGFREWIVELASSSRSEGRWVERTADGGFVVSGSYRDPEKRTKANILRTTSSGTLVWTDSLCIGSAECVRQTQDGGYVVTGRYYVPASQCGTSYMFLTKLAPEQKIGPK